jgi:hypothetical integral membrane protein (TIGR02206 family)
VRLPIPLVDFPTFGFVHNIYLLVCLSIWIMVAYVGRNKLNIKQQANIAILLAVFTIFQELLFDLFQIYIKDFNIQQDLSLHMCGISLFISSYALWKKNQTAFELSYFWGFAGAMQGLLTPDPSRWPYGDISIFWSFLSHGIIILNVVWLIFVNNMRCRKGSLLNTFLVTNAAVFIIGIINKVLGENTNYWFICEKPGGDNPFLIGEWPYYLFTFEIAAYFVMLIIYLPMWYVVNRSQKVDLLTTEST